MDLTTTIVLENLTFPECPRWHDGALWFSDVHAHAIIRMTGDGRVHRMIENARQPAGLGWLPNGDLLYVRMLDRVLVLVDAIDVAQPSPAVQSGDETVSGVAAADGSQPPPAVHSSDTI
ncbi:MAG: hypothetical protein HY873_06965, partial [Chloroflexi bacterium]|nr:hypothetical protein [Chloroflexota bacterium]